MAKKLTPQKVIALLKRNNVYTSTIEVSERVGNVIRTYPIIGTQVSKITSVLVAVQCLPEQFEETVKCLTENNYTAIERVPNSKMLVVKYNG